MNAIDIGKRGEKIAARYLRKNGYRIIRRNLHVSHNEIDIIAKSKTFLVFVEVKTRCTDESLYSEYGTPAAAVDHRKRQRIILAARNYINQTRAALQPRFDVVEVYLDKTDRRTLKVNHIINAFGAR